MEGSRTGVDAFKLVLGCQVLPYFVDASILLRVHQYFKATSLVEKIPNPVASKNVEGGFKSSVDVFSFKINCSVDGFFRSDDIL